MRQTSLPPRLEYRPSSPGGLDCSSPEDLTMSSEGEAPASHGHSGAPAAVLPPRLAARLHRAATSKRKSAEPSRRNSISSMQSGVSGRSGYSRTQNHHIAQHLRRASILEDRKAKIAERNAHAELVRMRAQQAKAAPRSNKAREDRTLAAQQARERHLAQVAASCAEEVKRAKKIAEETREKRAAEHIKLREDMEEKLAVAKRRRLQMQQSSNTQRRHRTHSSLASVEEKTVTVKPWRPKNQALAARVIQQAWRNRVRRRAIAEFRGLDLDVESVQALSFEAVTARVAEPKVLDATRRMLKLCSLLDESDDYSNREAYVRIFLCAYAILGHPKEILNNKSGDLEEELIGQAKSLLMQFQRLLSKPPTTKTFQPTSELMISLTEAYNNFQQAFADWKSRDASFIIQGAIAQFVELDAIWQTVRHDTTGGVADDYKEGIKNNQALILARLKRLLGPERAFKMITDAVKARRKAKNRGKPTGDVKPRMTTSAGAGPSEPGPKPSPAALPMSIGAGLPQPPRPARGGTSAQMAALNNASRVLPENRVLVHELAINKDYRIDVEHAAEDKQTAYRHLFNTMREDVENGMGDPWIISMAEWIKERLLRLVSPGKAFHAMITEFLDSKTISSQLRMGSFSYEKFFSFMNSILPKLCAPIRDHEVKALATDHSQDFIERLAGLMHVIELLALDHANYLLSLSAPELIRQAAQYEQKCFQEMLARGSLDRTLKWWRHARAHTVADLSRRSPEGTPPKPPSFSRIYTNGLVDLFVVQPSACSQAEVPETLDLDARRIAAARADVLRIVTVSSILLTAKNLLKRDVRTQWRTQAQRMWDLSGGSAPFADPAPFMQVLDSTSGAALPPGKRQSLAGTVETLLANARQSPNIQHPVMKVLLRKIREHAIARLGAPSSEEKVRATTTAAEVLGAGGMAEFAGRIGAIVDEMASVRQVDWDAHGRWIDEVAARVDKEAGGS